jgi:3-dehydroquinate dehydratase-2
MATWILNLTLSMLKGNIRPLNLAYFQSNVEGEIINKLHEVGFSADYILLNAGGYTHTSVAIADAVAAINTPVIEVHVSNILARER